MRFVNEEAMRGLKSAYYEAIRDAAQHVLIERRDEEHEQELISATAESFVIYTLDNLTILLVSDNWMAVEDVLGEDPSQWHADDLVSMVAVLALHAVQRDVAECIEMRRDEQDHEHATEN